jgi:hypothetical protein
MSVLSHFERIGPKVAPGSVEIAYDTAERFRKIALQGTKIAALELDNTTEILTKSYASGVLSEAVRDREWVQGVADVGIFARTTMRTQPDSWSSIVHFARFRFINDVDTKFYNHYEVTTVEGVVTNALRQVRIIRDTSEIEMDGTGDTIRKMIDSDRKTFEHPLRVTDIDRLQTVMGQVMARQGELASRRR